MSAIVMNQKNRLRNYGCLSLVVLPILALVVWLTPLFYERDMDCSTVGDARGKEICRAISEHLEFTCCGHAIISPGYRPTTSGIARTWCALNLTLEDKDMLITLSQSRDWRLESAAGSLLEMLTGRSRYGGTELSEMIFLIPQVPNIS